MQGGTQCAGHWDPRGNNRVKFCVIGALCVLVCGGGPSTPFPGAGSEVVDGAPEPAPGRLTSG